MATEGTARDLLTQLGFTDYEAQALVALQAASTATASELSERSTLPRSRVYDVMEGLADRGFVEICEGEPRRFRATPPEAITDSLATDFEDSIDRLDEQLTALETAGHVDSGQCRVWSIRGREQTLARGQELIRTAGDDVLMYASASLLEDECHDHLVVAAEHGVDVTVLADGDTREWFGETLTTATIGSPPAWLDGEDLVRVLLVDGRACQIATRRQATPTARPEIQSVLAEGRANGFVLAMRAALRATAGAE